MFQSLVDVIDTAHKNDTQLFVHIRVAMFSSFSVLLQYARTENLSGERSCLADAVKFEHFFFTVWMLGRLLFLRSCILFSPEKRPSEKRLFVITLVWALVNLRSSFSLIFAVYCFLISSKLSL